MSDPTPTQVAFQKLKGALLRQFGAIPGEIVDDLSTLDALINPIAPEPEPPAETVPGPEAAA